jgi:acyl-CoA synthetase (AMP-forming)/AMP-acid ligase II
MTSTQIKRQETLLQQEFLNLKSKFPDWNFYYELDTVVSDAASVVKEVIKQVKAKFPNYKFSICRDSCSCLVILRIKPIDKTEEFAYYGGDCCGYIVSNDNYRLITNEFKNNSDLNLLDIRVFEYIENSKTMELEFKQF